MADGERKAVLQAGLALWVLCVLTGCRNAPTRPSIVLILIDTLRSDHLRTYGYARETSPSLDALASRGVLFEEAVTAAPWTLPSSMSILTGRLPSSHRVENDGLKLSSSMPLLSEILKKAGYATAAVVSHIYISRPFGFDRGFDQFDDFGLSKEYRFEAGLEPRAAKVTDRALETIHSLRGKTFFLLVHYFDPHWDYDPPPPYDTRFGGVYRGSITGSYQSFSRYVDPEVNLSPEDHQHLVDLYDGEIAYTDAQIGRLVDGLRREGVAGRTIIAVTSDHGEEFKEHHSMGHGRNLYDEVLRVPLVFVDPRGRRACRRVTQQVRTIDLFPTLCQLAGAAMPPGIQGESLIPLLEGKVSGPRPAVTETIRFDAYRKSYRAAGEKLILDLEDNRRELYDLAVDPGETRNLWTDGGERARSMEQALLAQVDLLAGGWNLRWTSDGRPHRFSGSIETDGLLTALIPLFPEVGRHRVTRGKRIDFDLPDVTRGGGFSFRVDSPDARVAFALSVDGREDPVRIRVGGQRSVPSSIPFSFAGTLRSDLFTRPVFRPGQEVGFFLWRDSPEPSPNSVELDEALKGRLRSLGYIH